MLIMERKQLLINSVATSPIFNWNQKAYIAIFYLLLLVPVVLNFVYLFVIGLRLDKFVDNINQTKLLDYIEKTEKIVDFVCNNENIC